MKGAAALIVFIFSVLTVIPIIALLIDLMVNRERAFILEIISVICDPDV